MKNYIKFLGFFGCILVLFTYLSCDKTNLSSQERLEPHQELILSLSQNEDFIKLIALREEEGLNIFKRLKESKEIDEALSKETEVEKAKLRRGILISLPEFRRLSSTDIKDVIKGARELYHQKNTKRKVMATYAYSEFDLICEDKCWAKLQDRVDDINDEADLGFFNCEMNYLSCCSSFNMTAEELLKCSDDEWYCGRYYREIYDEAMSKIWVEYEDCVPSCAKRMEDSVKNANQ